MKRSGMRSSNENFQSVLAIKTKMHKGMMTFSLLAEFLLAPASAACSGGITFDHCSVPLINSSETVNQTFSEKIVFIVDSMDLPSSNGRAGGGARCGNQECFCFRIWPCVARFGDKCTNTNKE